MTNRIGIFDSGFGGFTVLKRIQERHPHFEAIYLADTERIPYGSKSVSEIRQIALEISQWFLSKEISALVVACNTTNSLALDVVRKFSKVPVFDLIGSLSGLIHESRIGVLATSNTVASKAYTKNIQKSNPLAFVIEEACPDFVPLIERGDFNSSELLEIAKIHIDPLIKANVEAIVLGCSHYPLIQEIFDQLLPDYIRIIDPAIALSMRMDKLLPFYDKSSGEVRSIADFQFYATADAARFASFASKLLGERLGVEVISLRSQSCVF